MEKLMPRILRQYASFFRAHYQPITMWPWATAVGCLIAGHGFPPILPTVIAILSMTAISSCAYIYNDVTDWEMDNLNPIKKNRPISSGEISVDDAMKIVYLTGAIGIALSLFLNPDALLLTALWMALFLTYSYPRTRFKNRFVIKEGLTAFGFVLTSLIGGAAVGSVSVTVIFSGIFFCIFIFIMRPAFLDTTDVMEDEKHGGKTLAMVLNWKTKIEMAIAFLLVTMTLTPFTYTYFSLNVIFPILLVAACLVFLRYLFPLLYSFEQKSYKRAFNALYGSWVLMQIALVLGSINFASWV